MLLILSVQFGNEDPFGNGAGNLFAQLAQYVVQRHWDRILSDHALPAEDLEEEATPDDAQGDTMSI